MVKRGKVKSKKVINKRENSNTKFNINKKIFMEAPISVKVASVYFYINAILSILFGIFVFIGGIIGISIFSESDWQKFSENMPSISSYGIENASGLFSTIIMLGLFVVIWGLIQWFIASGLYKGKRIAFIAASLLVIIGFISSLVVVAGISWSGLVSLVIFGVLVYCLFIDKGSREFFELGLLFRRDSGKNLKINLDKRKKR